MDEQDPQGEQQPTLAGRALRALQAQRAAAVAPVDLTKAADTQAPVEEPAAETSLADTPVAETPIAETPIAETPIAETPVAEPPVIAEAALAEAAVVDAEPEEVVEPDAEAARPQGRNVALIVAAVLAVLALAFAVLGFVVYLHGKDSSSTAAARTRDDALTAARIDIATLNTLDYTKVTAGLQKWLAVTTGDFHDNIEQAAKDEAAIIAKAKRTTVGKVLDAALTDLDASKGTATVIASVEVTRTPAGGTSTVDRNRYRATLTKVGGAWKISDLTQVSVTLS